MLTFRSKHGESLVEVIVSLGVLAILFTGVLTMIIASVNLNISSRQRTEAVGLAQEKLNEFMVTGLPAITAVDVVTNTDAGGCIINPPHNLGGGDQYMGDAAEILCRSLATEAQFRSLPNNSCSYRVLKPLNTSTELGNGTAKVDEQLYAKAESHVRWWSKGLGIEEYVVTKLARIK